MKKKTNRTDASEELQEEKEELRDTLKQMHRSNRFFLVMLLIIALVLVGLFWRVRNQAKQEPLTFEDWYDRTISGQEGPRNYLYNDFVFIKQDVFWKTLVARQTGERFVLAFHNDPKSVQDIVADPGVRGAVATRDRVVLTTDANLTSRTVTGVYGVGRLLGTKYDLLGTQAVLAMTTAAQGISQATCANVTENTSVIYFHLAETQGIDIDESGCVHVTGRTEEEIVASADKLQYILLNIIENPNPQVDDYVPQASIKDWKGSSGYDGIELELTFMDHQGDLVAPEGVLRIAAMGANETVLRTWETPLTVTQYVGYGTVRLRLAAPPEQLLVWVQQESPVLQVDYVSKEKRMSRKLPFRITSVPTDAQMNASAPDNGSNMTV
ncbi:MAG: hypothetical protein ACOCWQ_00240 [Nanoarchaeota archaeon]